MRRRLVLSMAVALSLAVAPAGPLAADGRRQFTPGAPGIGDPYFPLDGNGGYDVEHYRLDVGYDPATDELTGVARITARATQNLSRFNLDLEGLTVRAIEVDGRAATWTRDGSELSVTPSRHLRNRSRFLTVVAYDGVPEPINDTAFGPSGFMHTDDGALVVGEPDVAATWYPVNDHPSDTASYTLRITVPEGTEAVSNGVLRRKRTSRGSTTWTWVAREPMASYLATATTGEFDLRAYRRDGIRYWDAIDPDLLVAPRPRTGEQFAISLPGNGAYKRLVRTIEVPDDGARLSLWTIRDTAPRFDFMLVEAHTVDQDDWTTLPDSNGHTSQDPGIVCGALLELHPFLTRYQTDNGDGTCAPTGSSGRWWAASGSSDGYEQWDIDLSAYAGKNVEVAISYVTPSFSPPAGVVVDDIEVTTGDGTTSFEDDGDQLDGWTVPGAPDGSASNPDDWTVGAAADAPPTAGSNAEASFARQPEIIRFLADRFGPYPFAAAGGIVDDADIFIALENQTRPIYSRLFFGDPLFGDVVVVHELAHQWYGDSLALAAWQHIWLNEGFATYAEWLWSEHEGLGTVQEIFEGLSTIPPDDPFWSLTIGDPGPNALFDAPVYLRGGMTLHALRREVGDRAFFRIMRRWAQSRAGENVTTDEFIQLAENVSGTQLDALFDTWLFTPEKPEGLEVGAPGANARTSQDAAEAAVTRVQLLERLRR